MNNAGNWITYWSQSQRGLSLLPKNDLGRTVEINIPINIVGNQLKLRFSNDYGLEAVCIQDVHVRYKKTVYRVSFHQCSYLNLVPGIQYTSDPIELNLEKETTVEIRYFINENAPQRPVSGLEPRADSGITVKRSNPGNYANFLNWQEDTTNDQYQSVIMLFTGIDIFTTDYKKTVVAFGDSITEQGIWTNPLKKHLKSFSVINQGISGNRLLRKIEKVTIKNMEGDPQPFAAKLKEVKHFSKDQQFFGESGIRRFERDVFMKNVNVSHVIIAIGINDLYQPGSIFASMDELPPREEMIAGYVKLIETAKLYDCKVFLSTITPFGGAEGVTEKKEKLRREINHWIRHTESADSYFDFSKQIESNGEFPKIQTIYDSGDHLHPNSLGGKKMFECIDLGSFE